MFGRPLKIFVSRSMIPFAAAILLAAGPSAGSAQTRADAARSSARSRRVARLIAELSSGQYARRQHAKKELLAIGWPALRQFRTFARSHAAVAKQAPELMAAMRLHAALKIIRVSIRMHNASALEVLRRIAQETKANFKLRSPGLRSILARKHIDFDVSKMAFWPALIKFNALAGTCLDASKKRNSTDGAIDLYRARGRPRMIVSHGPWALQLNAVRLIGSKPAKTNAAGVPRNSAGLVHFSFDFFAQPGVEMGATVFVNVFKATRGKDKPFLVPRGYLSEYLRTPLPGGYQCPQLARVAFAGDLGKTFNLGAEGFILPHEIGTSVHFKTWVPHAWPRVLKTLIVEVRPTFFVPGHRVVVRDPMRAKSFRRTFGGIPNTAETGRDPSRAQIRLQFVECVALPGGRYRSTEKISGDYWQVCGVNRSIMLRNGAGQYFLASTHDPRENGHQMAEGMMETVFTAPRSLKSARRLKWKPTSLLIPVPHSRPSRRRPFVFHQKLLFVFHNVPIPS